MVATVRARSHATHPLADAGHTLRGLTRTTTQALARVPLLALASALLLAPAASAHDDDQSVWRSEGLADFARGVREGTEVDLGNEDLVLQRFAGGGFETQGSFLSPMHPAPEAFDSVMIGFGADVPEGTELRVQVRALGAEGGGRSRWYTVEPESELLLDRPHRVIQYRVHMVAHDPQLTPRFRFFTAVLGERLDPGADDGRGTGNGNVPRPEVVSRSAWGAKPPRGSYSRHQIEHLVVHHTYAPNASQYQGAASVRGIQKFHQDSRGWMDIGYHFLIGPDGVIFQGRPQEVSGAHVIPNRGKVGVCMIGNFDGVDTVTPVQREALVALLAWLAGSYDVNPTTEIFGHRDWMSTGCPGQSLYDMLPSVREAVKQVLDDSSQRVLLD